MHSKNESVSLGTFPLYKKVLLDLIMSPHSLQPPLLSCLFVFKLGSALVDCPSQLICTWIFMTKLKAGKSANFTPSSQKLNVTLLVVIAIIPANNAVVDGQIQWRECLTDVFLAVQDSSIGDLVSQSVSQSVRPRSDQSSPRQ